jgi:glycolate oxidase
MDLAATLERALGAGKVLGPEAGERLDDYGRDECDEARYRRRPDCVVLAAERADVEAVLRICRERRVPVTPRGAGSGKAGACVPLEGGVVLSTERMRRLVEVDGDDLVAVAEPGVITGTLQEAVEAAGMFYPPDPASLAFSTIGGNVVTNAGG